MTTRDELRRRVGARGEVGEGFAADAGPTLPERLHAARERKGVDLYRAERDTKIRSRYLAALEHGEYAELPGAVYTKGFLRNYALYLGLDAEDVIRQWKRERGDESIPPEPSLAVPKPLEAPRQGLTFSPAVVVAALLTVLIAVFAVFLGVQLIRFAKPPTLAVTDPATAVIDVAEDATSYTLRGTSIPNATITVAAAGKDQPYRESADSLGNWQVDVELRRGRNQFDINALDADTGKTADTPARVFITVPFNVAEAPALTVDSPAEGAQFENGSIPVKGSTTNAKTVSVSAILTGPAKGAPPSVAPSPVTGKPDVGPTTVNVDTDGTFDAPLDLAAGKWQVAVTATSPEGKTVTVTRNVAISYQGVNLVVEIKGSRAWLKVWVDGKLSDVTGAAGRVYDPGKTVTFTAKQSVEVRTGKSSATFFTLNGDDLGHMSNKSNPETWLFAPPAPPARTTRT